ncbi:MAG TPA: homocysteine S-methyltransferase family protein, partial [Terracidiphilus sp.]|nr:homocysteine S-methyltransferase family protein [Terracidiphilus sp.]
MTTNKERRAELLRGVRVLDGGLATELELRGARIDGPLWSAQVLEDEPERLAEVHRAYAEAGADVVATASYQVSRKGYEESGLSAAQADAALTRAVEIARDAVEGAGRRVLVAASLGPYGAVLHNGAEYHGNYEIGYGELVAFHRERIAVLARAEGRAAPDLLAFETIPSLDEARAIGEAM